MLVGSSHVWKMQKQPFPVGGGASKKFEDWRGGLKILGLVGGFNTPIQAMFIRKWNIGRKWVDFIWQPISIMRLLARLWTKFCLRKPVDNYAYFLRTFDRDSFSEIYFNSFMTKVTIMQKSVHWFTKQINGLVSIC